MKRPIRLATLAATAALVLVGTSAAFAKSLARDVDPVSRNRLPLAKAEDAGPKAKAIYDRTTINFAGVPPKAPTIRLHGTPEGALDLQMLSPLGMDIAQIPVLVAGRELDQQYEWSLHESQAIAVSLDPKTTDVIRYNRPISGLKPTEAVIIEMGREIFRTHRLGAATYARALRVLGQKNLVDVVGLMADYASVSTTLTAFNQQMPPGFKEFLPLPFTPPNDIHADSRNRLPLMPENPTRPGILYSRPMGGSPAGTGPGQIGLHNAGLKAIQASVPAAVIDVAILATAREYQSAYDWTVNELAAVQHGLEPKVIDVIRSRGPTAGLPEEYASLIELAREVHTRHYATAATYARAVKAFGERNLVALVQVMGQHAGEAVVLAAFDQQLPPGQAPLCCVGTAGR
jgi:4-carboxymuconolactone decarboxylase